MTTKSSARAGTQPQFLNRGQRTVLAAVMAITNMGHPRPDEAAVARLFHGARLLSDDSGTDLHNAVTALGSQYMESEHHQRVFADEAASWYRRLRSMKIAEIRQTWQDTGDLIDAMQPKQRVTVDRWRAAVRFLTGQGADPALSRRDQRMLESMVRDGMSAQRAAEILTSMGWRC